MELLGDVKSNVIEYPIEHSYVDFNWHQIVEKIHSIEQNGNIDDLAFNHLFYAKIMTLQYFNLDFYG